MPMGFTLKTLPLELITILFIREARQVTLAEKLGLAPVLLHTLALELLVIRLLMDIWLSISQVVLLAKHSVVLMIPTTLFLAQQLKMTSHLLPLMIVQKICPQIMQKCMLLNQILHTDISRLPEMIILFQCQVVIVILQQL